MGERIVPSSTSHDPKFEMRLFRPLSVERVQQVLGDRYVVTREIGAGGTAIVFLADDRERGQPVAVKVLRPELSVAVVAARFLREIEIGQRLSHPNVLPIFEYGSADGELYCTMPFVDGETLRQRLARERHLSVADTLRIAGAVANALDYAHGLDVIHRDIKPANILLDRDRVVVADYGMARAMTMAASGDLTETGLVIGTAAYMSPEQGTAERALDGRTDVYSLACVVYEMLAGEPPFTGPTQQAIIARHSQEPPRSLRVIRPSLPGGVQQAVERALAKVPADRYATAGEFLDALEIGARHASGARPDVRPPARQWTPWIAAGLGLLAAVTASAGWWRATRLSSQPSVRFTIPAPPGETMSNEAIGLSRDGRILAFQTGPRGKLYIQRLDGLEPVFFPKATRAFDLHFSADGKTLLYTGGSGPTVIPTNASAANTEPRRLWSTFGKGHGWAGIDWKDASNALYIFADTLWRVPTDSSAPRQAIAAMDTTVDAQWRQPVMLSDGKTIALRVALRGALSSANDRLALVSFDGRPRTLLGLESKGAIAFIDGVLIFVSVDGRIMGVRFDLARRQQIGAPAVLVEAVDIAPLAGGAMAAVSNNGTLAYMVSNPPGLTQIVDERGTVIRQIPDARRYYQTVWSPDGKRIALYTLEKDQRNIGVYDFDRDNLTTLPGTTGGFWPVWTSDGTGVAFTAMLPGAKTGGRPMWVVPDGRSRPEPIPGTAGFGATVMHTAFSPDGKYVLVRPETRPNEPNGTLHAFAVPLAGGLPFPVVDEVTAADYLKVSPNGRWLAYSALDSNRVSRVYVRPFPHGEGRVQLSLGTGAGPRWSRDGTKLLYSWGKVFSVTLDTTGALPRAVRVDSLLYDGSFKEQPFLSWDLHPDGKRFVVTRNLGSGTRLVVVTNWMTEVRAKLAASDRGQ